MQWVFFLFSSMRSQFTIHFSECHARVFGQSLCSLHSVHSLRAVFFSSLPFTPRLDTNNINNNNNKSRHNDNFCNWYHFGIFFYCCARARTRAFAHFHKTSIWILIFAFEWRWRNGFCKYTRTLCHTAYTLTDRWRRVSTYSFAHLAFEAHIRRER